MEKNDVAIELRGIRKTFGEVIANDAVDLSVNKGEILALLGENGSGKTTLMNVLLGMYSPDKGEIYVDGKRVSIKGPIDARKLGIGMVHQHFKLVDNLSAADNILLGSNNRDFFLKKQTYNDIETFCKEHGFDIDLKKKIYDMSVSEKQMIEIIKVLYHGAKVLVFDEPTAVLTEQEITKFFSILRKLKEMNYAVIMITHKLNEVMDISDRVTILRKGKTVGTVETKDTNAQELTNMMVGQEVELAIERPIVEPNETLMEVKNVTILNQDGTKVIDDVSFKIHRGEILGVAGVSGCGQKELCEALAGLLGIEGGVILYKGQNIVGKTPREITDAGISMSFVPEDRLGMGLAASLNCTDNMMLKDYYKNPGPLVDREAGRQKAQRVIDELSIVVPSTETPVRRLSGGNIQKLLVGREILNNPNVIITAYPVRGLDIHSSYTIYDILNKQKCKGVGILFIGEDIDVMRQLCDRIMVLCHGKVTGTVDGPSATNDEIGLLMTGTQKEPEHTEDFATDQGTAESSNKRKALQYGKKA